MLYMNTQQFEPLTLDTIKQMIRDEFDYIGYSEPCLIKNIKSIEKADSNSLVWCSPNRSDKQNVIENTSALLIICDSSVKFSDTLVSKKGFIIVENPKLVFTRLVRTICSEQIKPGIHPSATIHHEAKISKTAYIGPNSYIGKCEVGDYSVLHGNNFVYDGTTIGEKVVIEAGAILGAEGFGLAKSTDGIWERFPHIGGLEIHDNVEIGAATTIDRGTLENTVIGKGTKISKSVHISHNVIIGKNCLITGSASIAGSTRIGDDVWISPNSTILNKLSIGNNVFISVGATVTQNIGDNQQAIGRKILPKK